MVASAKGAAPAFIHIDVDDLWAVGECYNIQVAAELRHRISEGALPRFRQLFRQHGIKATFFLVGRDLESLAYVELVKGLLADGHAVANHSYTHRLDFRAISPAEMRDEVERCHFAARQALGCELRGFRAPGYAWSPKLLDVLADLGYDYDASLMPSPWGFVFRWMDARLQKQAQRTLAPGAPHAIELQTRDIQRKTQYPLFSNTFKSLSPRTVELPGGKSIMQLPSATSNQARLPFQAGVCMRLGYPYFQINAARMMGRRRRPFVFLFHAADLADLSNLGIPFFQKSSFFSMPIAERLNLANDFLKYISQHRPVTTTEEWLR